MKILLLFIVFVHVSLSTNASHIANHTSPSNTTEKPSPMIPTRATRPTPHTTSKTTKTVVHGNLTAVNATSAPRGDYEVEKHAIAPTIPSGLGRIPQKDKEFLERLCSGGKCMGQTAEAKHQREEVKRLRIAALMKISPFHGNFALAEKSVEMTLRRIQLAKIASIRRFGIPKNTIDPADDGLWEGDMLVSNAFAVGIWKSALRQIPNMNEDSDFTQTNSFMSLNNENMFDEAWSMPIYYQIDDSISKHPSCKSDAAVIREAVAEINSMTVCTEIVEKTGFLSETDLSRTIVFQKMNISMPSNLCTLSTHRRGPVNNVYLNCACLNIKGNAIHSLLHVLGVLHHHNRVDRDKYLSVAWLNVDLHYIDYFIIHDQQIFSTFGTPFDVGSIMNYHPSVASKGLSKAPLGGSVAPTMVVKHDVNANQASLGQKAGMSCTDAEVLKKSYCCNKECRDKAVSCGHLATSGLCCNAHNHSWMSSQCPKSCRGCCVLKCSSRCESFCKNAMPKC